LEVAAGTGDLALTLPQSVGSTGHVVAVDISANMLAYAEKAAREAGLSNIETRVMDAGKLDFQDDSFNAVICRMALMLFQEPLTALAEMHRVVKLGGKVAVMVWSSAERNPFHGLPLQIARRIGNMPAPKNDKPGLFALGDRERLEDLFRKVGFRSVATQSSPFNRKYVSLDDAITSIKSSGGAAALKNVMDSLSKGEQEKAWAEITQALTQFDGPSGFEAPGEVLIGVGTK
jgi:ubiquinone/menaquinone biosynthesis C-methylase UbiE